MTTFNQWFDDNLADYAEDIANHGADTGFPAITYTSDCVALYDEFESEIYEKLNESADEFGYETPEDLISTFNRKDMLHDPDQRKNLLLWFMVEERARELSEQTA